MWRDRIPASVAFCDVETTGLSKDDRIVSFGGIGIISDEFAKGRLHLAYGYLVFDPGRRNNRGAGRFMDFRIGSWPFRTRSNHAAQIGGSSCPELLCPQRCVRLQIHQSRDDIGRTVSLSRPIYHHERYRALGLGGSASLSAVCSIKLARSGQLRSDRRRLARHAITFGCTAVLSSAIAVRCLELRPTSVTSKSAGSAPFL
jgi:hypothetical protein